jgi:hypothetical protein
MDNKIYKEAILDAKALRAGAIANAKSIMQEALAPAIQEMMRLKLSEELEEEIEEGYEEEGIEEYGDEHAVATKDALEKKEEGEMKEDASKTTFSVPANDASDLDEEAKYFEEMLSDAGIMAKVKAGIGELEVTVASSDKVKAKKAIQSAGYQLGEAKEEIEEVTDATLEEILAELDALEEDQLNEAEEDEEDEEEIEADEEAVTDELPAVKPMDTKLIKLTLGDLKAALMPQAAEMGDEAGEESEEAPLSLDEILAEMEAERKEEGKEPIKEDAFIDIVKQLADVADIGFAEAERLINALGGGAAIATVGGLIRKAVKADKAAGGSSADSAKAINKSMTGNMEEELEMAKETIAELRESINEINLLNAKLLYMNKIFKAKSLTESEKVKVVKAFDRNASIKEVKNTYATLSESFQAKKSQVIKESVGFASKPIGVAPKTNIVEADAFVSRWQKIAGIK